MSTLKSIFCQGVEFEVAEGKTVLVKEIELQYLDAAIEIANALNFSKTDDLIANIKSICSKNIKEIQKLIEITTDLTKEDIKKLNLAAVVMLVTKAVEVNANFLAESVVPNALELLANVKVLTGSTKSKD